MKKTCDICGKPATNHSVEISGGKHVEMHLCDECAGENLMVEPEQGDQTQQPISELLTNFVKMQVQPGKAGAQARLCEHCGLSFAEFQSKRLLGCPHCYASFEEILVPLLERAHEGGDRHIGKAPSRSGQGGDEQRQEQILQMRKRLAEAVTSEDYELAADLRDQIGRIEGAH